MLSVRPWWSGRCEEVAVHVSRQADAWHCGVAQRRQQMSRCGLGHRPAFTMRALHSRCGPVRACSQAAPARAARSPRPQVAPRPRAVLGSLHPLQIAPTNVMAAPACFRAAPSGKLTTQPCRSGLAARSTPPSSVSSRVAVVRSSSNGAGPVAAVGATEVRRPTRRRICAGVPDWICTLAPPALCTECMHGRVSGPMLHMYA